MTEGQSAPVPSGSVYPLGRYLVLAELGRGGMAEVYLALSRGPNGFNKLVVLKLLRAHLAEDEDFLRMFLAEARLAARLNHANIVQTYEIGVEGGRHCIVMEYLEGRSFAEVEAASRQEPMSLNLGVRVLGDTLAALHYAHELCDVSGRPLGLVHRDVSPHNLLVTYDGQVKLLDFGIAKAADDGARTKTGVFKGKLRYTAPERFAGEDSDRRSDIFSVGVMLWQLLTKRRLWSGMNELAVMQQLATRSPIPSARSVNPEVPALLDEVCTKALAPAAADRFATAAEMQDALEELLAADSVGATNRALGKYMSEVFGETRKEFQRTVDEQIRAAADMPSDVEMTASVARMRAEGVPSLVALLGNDSASSIPAPMSFSRVRADVHEGNVSSTTSGIEAPGSEAPMPARAGKRRVALVLLALTLGLASLVIAVFLSSERPLPPTSSVATATASLPQPSSGPRTAVSITAPVAPAVSMSATAAAEGASPVAEQAPSLKHTATASPRFAPAQRVRPAPPPVESRAATPPPKTDPPKREVDCTSPYFIDDQGMKKIRPECL